MSDSPALWKPTADEVSRTRMREFTDWLKRERGLSFRGYEALWEWSVNDLDGFWSAVWQFFGLDAVSGYDAVLGSRDMPGAEWFPGATLNFADQLLRPGAGSDPAIVSVSEGSEPVTMSRAELRRQVASLATTLSELGVGRSSRVVGYLPNVPEAIVAFLATAWLGATWSSVGQDYAAPAVVDRFGQLEPTIMVAADGYRFGGREHDRLAAVTELRRALPTVSATVIVPRLRHEVTLPSAISWDEATSRPGAGPGPELVPFSHPLWVLFSSGTTGLPKGIVHGHGGVLLEQLKSLGLHWDLDRRDRFFWFTSPSWVMWNLLLSGLVTGSSVVTYDGSPTYPDPGALWKVVSDAGVTVFGTSPGYLQATRDAGIRPAAEHDLSMLRSMGSTGSPLAPDLHQWAAEAVGPGPLFSISGGTDIAAAFCGGAPTCPVWPGELSVRNLGVAMQAWDDEGRTVRDQVGELVVTRPMPSMPVHLWNDPDGQKYRDAYFSTFPGVWRHGDWVTVTSRGSVVVHGRSDSTLNRNGIRMGSADIYHAVESLADVSEALVVGVEQPDGSYWMPLFVVLADGVALDADLETHICDAIRRAASPRHVPDEVIAVPGIPHTRTGKKLEVPIKRILQGAAVDSVLQPGSLDDPALLAPFVLLARDRAGLD
ncbi:acetoacetate--CoA ligase [Micromonospora sp. ATA32]|nr:acetoacetate--CoA ligase [Micromonospora sp. ATA32]